MRNIITAKSAGFCFGVSRSVSMAEKLLEEGRAYSLGSLIHNDDVVSYLGAKGLEVINSPAELPEGGRVILRLRLLEAGAKSMPYAKTRQNWLNCSVKRPNYWINL